MNSGVHRFQGTGQELGYAIGRQFGRQIRESLAENTELADRFRPYHQSVPGRRLYARLLALHEQHYGDYVAELRGCAQGAQVPFEDLWLINLRGEYRGYAAAGAEADIGECSTCSLMTADHAAFGHNEDGAQYYLHRSYLIHVQAAGKISFLALCYPGFLPSNAFGANQCGLCYSINNVRPNRIEEGLGRHYLARSLLQATSLDDAVACLGKEPRAAGFNFTLASIAERKILNVEVSPTQIHQQEISGRYFHANHYRHLQLDQQCEPSSVARQQRAASILESGCPASVDGVIKVLQDQAHPQLPIWRRGQAPDPAITLLSAVFDLDAPSLSIYPGPLAGAEDVCQATISLSLDANNFADELS